MEAQLLRYMRNANNGSIEIRLNDTVVYDYEGSLEKILKDNWEPFGAETLRDAVVYHFRRRTMVAEVNKQMEMAHAN